MNVQAPGASVSANIIAVDSDFYAYGLNYVPTDDAQPPSDRDIRLMRPVDMSEAMTTAYSGEASFCVYRPSQLEPFLPAGWPRILKKTLPALRAAYPGFDLVSDWLVVEYDLPSGEASWTLETLGTMWRWMEHCRDERGFDIPMRFAWWYTTRHGCRWIYRLSRAIDVDELEQRVKGAVELFAEHSIYLDPNPSDWTRFFRLPRVTRDGVRLWEAEWFRCYEQPVVCDPEEFPLGAPVRRAKVSEGIARSLNPGGAISLEGKPTAAEAHSELYILSPEGRQKMTTFHREARKRLRSYEWFQRAVDGQPLANEGGRMDAIYSATGAAAKSLHSVPGASKEALYGFFLPSVSRMIPDGSTPDWSDELWRACSKWWHEEQLKVDVEVAEAQIKELSREGRRQELIERVKQWCSDPAIHSQDLDQAMEWIRSHAAVIMEHGLYFLTPEGHYTRRAYSKDSCSVAFLQVGIAELLGYVRGSVPSYAQIVAEHAYSVDGIQIRSNRPGTSIEVDKSTGRSLLVISQNRLRKDLQPTFFPLVDEWLKRLGGEHYKSLVHWIAHALAFDEAPICGLSICAAPGAGKTLLAQGLAECLEVPTLAQGDELVGFQKAMRETPFVWLNEGLPPDLKTAAASQILRQLISGGTYVAKVKFSDPIEVNCPYRILMTANNPDMVAGFARGKELTIDDIEAISQRIYHFDAGSGASEWLEEMGGKQLTGSEGARWISKEGGGDSDYIVARHFLWLYMHRQPVPRGRFLMDGGDTVREVLRMGAGRTPEVTEAIIHIRSQLLSGHTAQRGCFEMDGKFYVTVNTVVSYLRRNGGFVSRNITASDIQTVLRSLSASEPLKKGKTAFHGIPQATLDGVSYTYGFGSND